MRRPEAKFWDRVKRNLKKYPIFLNRVENIVGTGDPDVEALANGLCTKIELKAVLNAPKRHDTPLLGDSHGTLQTQRNWHLEWQRYKGRSIFLVGVGSFTFYAIDGSHHDELNDMTLEQMADLSLCHGWPELAQYLGVKL